LYLNPAGNVPQGSLPRNPEETGKGFTQFQESSSLHCQTPKHPRFFISWYLNKYLMQTRTLLILLVICCTKLQAQTAEKFTLELMQTKAGAKVVYNSDAHAITLDIVSNKIVLTGNPNLVNVDNKPFQFVLIANNALSTTDTTLARQKAELLGYADYEIRYIKDEVKLKISGFTQKWVTINNKLFLFWSYDMPADNKSVRQQINLSTLCFAHVLNLNNAVTNDQTIETNQSLLFNAANTLKLAGHIDLKKLYQQLQDEMKQ
jgi:hypothetical protein